MHLNFHQLSRNFCVKKTRSSCSKEVRILSEIVARAAQTVTGRNLLNIEHEYLLNPWIEPVKMFKEVNVKRATPTIDEWRIGLLKQLLYKRQEMDICGENVEDITSLIDSLCSS